MSTRSAFGTLDSNNHFAGRYIHDWETVELRAETSYV